MGELVHDSATAEQEADEIERLLAAAGIRADEPVQVSAAAQEFHLWPENLPSFALWQQVQTQWRTDFGVRTGLDYAAIKAGWLSVRQCRRVKRSSERLMGDLQAMERAALLAWAEQRAKEKQA